MSIKIVVSCPECQAKLRLKNRAHLGKRRDCPRCGHSFVLRAVRHEEKSEQSAAPVLPRRGSQTRGQVKKAQTISPKTVVIAAGCVLSVGIAVGASIYFRGPDQGIVGLAVQEGPDSFASNQIGDPDHHNVASPDRLRKPLPLVPTTSESTPAVSTTSATESANKTVLAADDNTTLAMASTPRSSNRSNRASGDSTGWYQWRGPKRDGVSTETGLLDRWPNGGPPLAWRVRGLGSGMSSVSISGDHLFTMGNKRGQTHIICRNLSDGSEVWSTSIGGGSPNCTPTVDPKSGLVFGLTHAGDLVCLNAATGKEVWRKNFGRDFGGRMMSGWGYSESPLIDGDHLICTPGANDAIIAALDKKTGRTIWKSKQPADVGRRGNDGAGYSSVVISNGAGVKQYVQLTGRGLISVAADDGRTLWVYNRVANNTANVPTPIVKGDYIFCSSGYGTGAGLVKLSKRGRNVQADEVYFLGGNTLQNHHGGMVLIGDHVYMGHGHNNGFPICVEFATGKIVWGGRIRGAGSGSAAVVCADGHLYFRYEDATMALIEVNPRGYNLKSKFRIASNNGKSWSHPVIYKGRLYLRDQDELLCYNVRR